MVDFADRPRGLVLRSSWRKGEKAADLPVEQVVKVEFVINLKSAKTLGLTLPLALLGRANEQIE
jgi:putative ABC transport system substrate-binding protein